MIEHEPDERLSLRLGLRYVRGFKQATALELVAAREQSGLFQTVGDLARRVPSCGQRDLAQLARIGALNGIAAVDHRRDAAWQIAQAGRPRGPLLHGVSAESSSKSSSPLCRMSTRERLVADYAGTGLTVDRHPMACCRPELRASGVLSARELHACPDGIRVVTAGTVIARQRPGTAMGFIFLSMEDETGISNVIVHPSLYDRDRLLITRSKSLRVAGRLQNQDGVIHVRAENIELLHVTEAFDLRSHDFH
jgi:error-prone DNA polymerase